MKYYPQWKKGTTCPNNDAVICRDSSQCSKCGWNPEVAKKRTEERENALTQKVRKDRGNN